MEFLQIAALPGGHPSDAITDVLGGVAVCAFFGIACYIAFQVLRDSSKTAVAAASNFGEMDDKVKELAPKEPLVEENELEVLEKHCEKLLCDIEEAGRSKLEDFAQVTAKVFEQVAGGYASNSFGHEGETHAVRSKKFQSVCDRQWGSFRSEVGYMSYMDIQEHLRHILVNHRMLNAKKNSDSDMVDLSPELLRSQELVALMRVVSKEKVRLLQEQLLKAVGDFREYFQDEVKVWLNDQISKISLEMRPRRSKKVQLTDTDYYKRFKQLKTRLEIIARLSDGVTEKTQQVSESGLALSQVIHVGTVLRIMASLPEWFSELGLGVEEALEVEQA
ncbi:hypothetical protein VDG1235_2700 [Verrucomicrobiia bacterium DG1235]|nr:hypothetical protein VDG1235_2700 [Verrucomicrobiae bacterium DG1235]